MRKHKHKTYILVDGYNVINAIEDLKEKSESNLEHARDELKELMSEYSAYFGDTVYLVFDAYNIKGFKSKVEEYKGINVIYTKANQTADAYIEALVQELMENPLNLLKVVTNDRAEQQQVMGKGALRITALELYYDLQKMNRRIMRQMDREEDVESHLKSRLNPNVLKALNRFRNS